MKRVIFATVGTVVGLIMLLSFKTQPVPTSLASPPAALGDPATPSTTTKAAGGSPTTTAAAPAGSTTVTGDAAQTRFGPVQVKITVTDGTVSAVDAVEYPTASGRDRQINASAIPELDQEAVAAKSADIDMVSGATYTSTGYVTSLQSALNKAGLS